MNLFHLPIGNLSDSDQFYVNAVVEIPKDTNTKYEYDIEVGYLKLDRCLISSLRYPASYGFVPRTISDDKDPLDILVFSSVPIISLAVVEVKIVGALHTIDDGMDDYKLLGIPKYNPNNYKDITDIDEQFLDVCKDFFENYKNLSKTKKSVIVKEWENAAFAKKLIVEKHKNYEFSRTVDLE
jgi:inorganic pyrophosphatase